MSAYYNGINYFSEANNTVFCIRLSSVRLYASHFFFIIVAEHHERDERRLIHIEMGPQYTDPSVKN